jgi:hypothetical protein
MVFYRAACGLRRGESHEAVRPVKGFPCTVRGLNLSRVLVNMIPDAALLAWNPASPAEARALVAAVQDRAKAFALNLPAPPAEPDNCCGNDCVECVWLGHYAELAFWRDDALADHPAG